jgi:hypothetical protein
MLQVWEPELLAPVSGACISGPRPMHGLANTSWCWCTPSTYYSAAAVQAHGVHSTFAHA